MKHHILIPRRSVPVPVPQARVNQELLVDELPTGLDSELANHPDVIWYPSNDALNQMKWPGDIWAMIDGGDANWYGTVAGYDGNGDPPIVAVPQYGMNCVRWGSTYSPDHFICDTNPKTFSSACSGKETLCNWRAYLNHNTREFSGVPGLGTTPYQEVYVRVMMMIEEDVEFGLTELGLKLGGCGGRADGQSPRGGTIFWYWPPSGGQTELTHYSDSASFGTEFPGPFPSHPIVNLGEWLALEIHMKQNTNHNTSDGEWRMWVNNVLVLERLGMKWHSTPPANGVVEVNHIHHQIYHGGIGLAPSSQIHHRVMGWCVAKRRIGPMRLV